jgi:hypothetical protein
MRDNAEQRAGLVWRLRAKNKFAGAIPSSPIEIHHAYGWSLQTCGFKRYRTSGDSCPPKVSFCKPT